MKAATFGKLEKKFLEMSEFKGANESFLVFFFFFYFLTLRFHVLPKIKMAKLSFSEFLNDMWSRFYYLEDVAKD